MSVQIENLLRPRYKVMIKTPHCHSVGTILEKHKYASGNWYVPNCLYDPDDYPEVFRKLEWHEDRAVEDMPAYVKSISQEYSYGVKVGEIIKVKEWAKLCDTMYVIQSKNREYHPSCFVPATLAEYEQYINQKEKQ